MNSSTNHNKNVQALYLDIKEKIGKPINKRVVKALIESFGIRNIDTKEDYGYASINALSEFIFEQFKKVNFKDVADSFIDNEENIPVSGYQRLKAKLFLRHYSLGLFHLSPIFLQIAAIIFFDYSLWTYLGFNELQSTAVVLGVITGLITTGGFIQVIGREASFYWYGKDYGMTKKVIIDLVKAGLKAIVLVFICVFGFNFFIHLYPNKFIFVVYIYGFLVGFLLLILGSLHTIKKRWVIIVSILVGTVIAIFLKEKTGMRIYFTHWLGILISILIGCLSLFYYFKLMTKDSIKVINKRSPKKTSMLYRNYKYFLYGVLLYIFIFMDRIWAWSSTTRDFVPFPVYFEKDYEIGMDIAILSFFLLAGVLEYSIVSFSKFLDIKQKNIQFLDYKNYSKTMYHMYLKHIGLLIISSCIASVLIYLMVYESWGYQSHFEEPISRISSFVYGIGSLGYIVFSLGMLNTLYLFTLNKPTEPLKALIWGCITNILVGLLLSRNISYEYSVVGMLCGSLVFMVMSLRSTISFFKNLDYNYYASY